MTRSRLAWLSLPAVVALVAIVWSVLRPAEICSSAGDTSVCADQATIRFVVATGGVGISGLAAGLIAWVTRVRRVAVVGAVASGLALLGLALASYVRAIT
jgi:hypothetical protein